MDSSQYTNLLEALAKVPDPRKAKGKQHEWRVVLAVLCGAVASGQRSVRAIAQWAKEHETELTQQLVPTKQRLPSAATLYRVLRATDATAVESHLSRLARYSCYGSEDQQTKEACQVRAVKHEHQSKPRASRVGKLKSVKGAW